MMKFTTTKLALALSVMAALAGCSEEKVPEPTKENCTAPLYEEHLDSLSKEANRNEFITNCKSFLKARKMTEWKFKKSPEDQF
ncbi:MULTISPECIES: entry exclusion lipoprotein TrbK [Pseudomonas]|jgi:entry exclusion lipoprotein TrbK|uniref:entry exclusion lipoprotein TrbK n=2 Tax=Pseudomonas TaxID=286 RepID=UPI000AF3B8D2|nr:MULTISPECIES: entry exclusion lipoprotein TrbK [Pseudomonas]ATP42616.1 entry exclusion lipoprotein TrbK [Pseudomonas putida]USS56107.1 entry exclusion lipoprotein TrbK [Pseudomonas kermanshahensis]UVL66988.1 entry exclusion lipoprotein TrbK [Pseudomonas sp. B21-031]